MNEYSTERAICYPTDFVLWQTNNLLTITPKFQRRPIWKTPARSFFIDTMLRGMTVPPIYLRMTQNEARTKNIREVVDGQQRVRAILDFIADGYRLSSTLKAPWAGRKYSQLSLDEQERITTFGISAEIFKGISDQQVLEVFCRLNTYSVPLNKQELRNGRYFGSFKQMAYQLAHDYLEFWRKQKLFTELSIARMLEVELTSELLIAGHDGMQDKKNSIDAFYGDHDHVYPEEEEDWKRFHDVMGTISESFNNNLSEGEFSRVPLFYTLYCVVFHHIFGIPGVQRSTPKKRLNSDQRESLKEAVDHLSDIITQSKEPANDVPEKYKSFVAACSGQTDNINPRKTRFNALYAEAF